MQLFHKVSSLFYVYYVRDCLPNENLNKQVIHITTVDTRRNKDTCELISRLNILFCSNLDVFYKTINTKAPFYVIKSENRCFYNHKKRRYSNQQDPRIKDTWLYTFAESSVYEHLVTTAARDQQLVPTTRTQNFLFKYCRKPHRLLSAQVFFSNLHILF